MESGAMLLCSGFCGKMLLRLLLPKAVPFTRFLIFCWPPFVYLPNGPSWFMLRRSPSRPPGRRARKIEINSASAASLQQLPGISEADAMEMLRRRPFKSWENIQVALNWDSEFLEHLQQSGACVSGG
ncbi:MAG: ComEA family DNA-binding protein [Verrucomicrobiales bacterium]